MKPIDADNLISVLDILSEKGGDVKYWEQLKSIVAECPTIDAEPVIRCKDCYWYGIVELKKDGTESRRYKPSWCFFWNAGMNEVDFCSLAERKEK